MTDILIMNRILKMQKVIVCLLLLSGCMWDKKEVHFITDQESRKTVEADFQAKKQLLAGAPENLFAVFDRSLTMEEEEALKFLYAYSPLIDLTMYGGGFLLENVRMSLLARQEMPWGKRIPEQIFRHFVLPVRGSNESLDSSRTVFWQELKDRVKNCGSMEEAALEVNHWCHEKAIYKPTNARTCSPLTMIKTAYGRCGEESVFALAAMRAVSIPARQVYTPRWAHCDDNHAWIEVWVDGEWKYLGACEPEPRLNIAWFTAPVRRGLFMVARVFGKYESEEETVAANPNMTTVNVTPNYTDARKVIVKVVDDQGEPVPAVHVEYKIYNYGEYYPAVMLHTDASGISSLTVGKGDWLIWASKGEHYGFGKLNAANTDSLVVIMDKSGPGNYHLEYDMVPPAEKEYQALVPDEERAVNDRRFMYEDSVRNTYIASFMAPETVQRKAGEWKIEADVLMKLVKGARGNYPEIMRFLEDVRRKGIPSLELALQLLNTLAEKDLQDITAEVLADHIEGAAAYEKEPRYAAYRLTGYAYAPLYRDYILNPRVKNEMITAYRRPLSAYLKENHISGIEDLLEAMKKIRLADSISTVNAATSPEGVLKALVTDTRSKEIFFVTACRTMGIASRLNPVDGKPEYNEGKGWKQVVFTPRQSIAPKGRLMVDYLGKGVKDPAYYTHFTISRLENGRARLIDLGSNADVDMGGGAFYSQIFRQPVELEEGDYILVTGNRKSDGSVLTTLTSFTVEAEKTTRVSMTLRDAAEVLKVAGKIDTAIEFMPENSAKPEAVRLPGKGYTVVALIKANQEPTNHFIRDMSNMKADFEAKGIPMYFLFTDEVQMKKFNRHDFRPLPDNMLLGYDRDGKVHKMLSQRLQLQNTGNLPLIVVVNNKGEVVFISQGYRVGLGTQIIKFIG